MVVVVVMRKGLFAIDVTDLLLTMDVDPLEDTVPPRYAVESDEEDEYNPLEQPTQTAAPETADIKVVGDIAKDRPLIIASGDAGKFWARGAHLGEQMGGVYVNTIAVGLLFTPAWSKSTVLVSEVTTRMPIWAMDRYAKSVIAELLPTSVSLLDTYVAPTYISPEPIPFHVAPVRTLSTTKIPDEISAHTDKLSPPNLIASTSASFLSNLAVEKKTSTLLLLPLSRIQSPLPKKLSPSDVHSAMEDYASWPEDTMSSLHQWLFFLNGDKVQDHPWVNDKKNKIHRTTGSSRKGDIGEGGMYI
ncbi:hypothetical protein CPB85DRAFT_683723 [Mucidula mucida]|nr:hypothetical protein CPB85DRAFT_683723 [Mucidula mucida]